MIEVEAYILAGGLSRRMGRSKANLKLGGRTLVERAAATLSAVTSNVFVVGSVEIEGSHIETIPDVAPKANSRGALLGLYSALRHARSEWAVVLACDLPFVGDDLMIRLVNMAESSGNAACVVPVQPDGRSQPLCAVYRTNACLDKVEELVNGDDWRLQNMLDRIDARRIAFSDIADLPGSEHFFFNVNSPADFEIASEIVGRSLPAED